MLSRFSNLAKVVNPFKGGASTLLRSAVHASVMHFDLKQPSKIFTQHKKNLTHRFSTKSLSAVASLEPHSIIEIAKDTNTAAAKKVCAEIADKLSGDGYIYCPAKVQEKLAAFFVQGNEKMRANYDGSFVNYANGILRGLELALTFNDNKTKALSTLQDAFDDGFSYGNAGVKHWAFGNLTGRVAHLYGLTSEGFFSLERVQKLLEEYNNCKDVNNKFLVLTHKVTRALIKANKMTPADASRYAEQLDEDPKVQNPLSSVHEEVRISNFKRSAQMGAGA